MSLQSKPNKSDLALLSDVPSDTPAQANVAKSEKEAKASQEGTAAAGASNVDSEQELTGATKSIFVANGDTQAKPMLTTGDNSSRSTLMPPRATRIAMTILRKFGLGGFKPRGRNDIPVVRRPKPTRPS